jgi:hypothetical protein
MRYVVISNKSPNARTFSFLAYNARGNYVWVNNKYTNVAYLTYYEAVEFCKLFGSESAIGIMSEDEALIRGVMNI